MRNGLVVATIFALGTGYLACSSTGQPATGFGDDAGSDSGSGSGSGGSSGGGSGSSSGTSSGGSSGSSGGSSGSSSGSSKDGGSGSSSGGTCTTNTGPISGTVGASGGSVSRLVFGVVGDTRPANEDDVGGYPTSIITKIFGDIQALTPLPVLVLGTGDYQFSNASSGTGAQQVDIYMQARQSYSGAFFPAMGNHECGVSGGFTTSDNNNCGPGNQGGATVNYNAFMSEMLAPISQTLPYYSVNVGAADSSWTAKFVMTAANSWDTAQQTWLQTTLAQKTTYTFVVRHEPSDASPPLPPGVAGVDAILPNYPYTLLIEGHDHTYGHYSDAPQAVIFGNGGAPLGGSKDYGYGLFAQRCDGAIVVDAIDYMSGAADSEFHFVVTPNGQPTQ
jgi:hypothetical protein